ncbi:hypothetical protein [Paenibacillus sp. OV219]|uniref:hypothetical protein n=1 Tax=Paenibacillus sp. OV219 TaxID=1884377 RepID=UPI0008D5D8BD|nr:hypothetical protein [Paenibacillus sp. OV219]SEM50879.1 hypothetical protein SAMN05518847_10123 [Paenibacillus sp. OV219]
MKLIGSITEQDFRRQLLRSHDALFTQVPEGNTKLRILQNKYSNLATAYSLHWIPEQGEDIVTYLINTDIVAIVETDRHDSSVEPIIKTMTVSKYKIGLSMKDQIKLAVALDLAQEDLRRNGTNK